MKPNAPQRLNDDRSAPETFGQENVTSRSLSLRHHICFRAAAEVELGTKNQKAGKGRCPVLFGKYVVRCAKLELDHQQQGIAEHLGWHGTLLGQHRLDQDVLRALLIRLDRR